MAPLILKELQSGKTFNIVDDCVIGRSHGADLVLADPSISSLHARIIEVKKNFYIEDLQSSNGVYLNNSKITEAARLREGDLLQLGRTRLVVTMAESDRKQSEQTVVLGSLGLKKDWELNHDKLRLVHEITGELISDLDLKLLTERIFLKFRPIFNQDRSYLALFKEDGLLEPLFSEPPHLRAPISRSFLERVFRNGDSLLLEDALSDPAFQTKESVLGLRIRSALCVPLIFHQRIYGVIYMDNNTPGRYKHADLEFLRTIAFILGPLLENARLWSELKQRHENTLETLKKTQKQLIDMERKTAYIHLAQAMAHEIRNPLMAAGGLLARMARLASEQAEISQYRAVLSLLERIELILKEVDSFVRIPEPHKELVRIDNILQHAIEKHRGEWESKDLTLSFGINTPYLVAPLDVVLFDKAVLMILREVQESIPKGSKLEITLQDSGSDLEVVFGETDEASKFLAPFDPGLKNKPWSFGLFLNIAYKIISDHGGTILLDQEASSAYPIILKIPREMGLLTSPNDAAF